MSLKSSFEEVLKHWPSATQEQFARHSLATFFRNDVNGSVEKLVKAKEPAFEIKASVGAGNWASVPWISILNPLITTSTQNGIYPVYLFRSDGSGLYLSLGFGSTELKDQHGAAQAEREANELRERIRNSDSRLNYWDDAIDLRTNTALGRSYEWASAGAKFYPLEDMPDDSTLTSDLNEILEIYSGLNASAPEKRKPSYTQNNSLTKPFLLLAGISGTGKTRFVRKQAEATGSLDENYCLVSVRPDWHEPSDLLGYVSRLNGPAEFVTTDVLQFVAKTWRALVDNGVKFEIGSQSKRLQAVGDASVLSEVKPYWLCLDEMNLAPVEQYFADYLSVLETREWCWEGNDFAYSSDALLKPTTIQEIADKDKLRKDLGFEPAEYDELWQLICEFGLAIPFNLIVAGTVNMDETTHGFSRKVIDRALSFDFGEFFPNDFDQFFESNTVNKTLSYPLFSQAKQEDLSGTYDADGQKSVAFLKAVNAVLKNTPFELAYRALNELLLSVACAKPEDELTIKAVWDDFLMCKVLPRIEGDIDKLGSEPSLLEQLTSVLEEQFGGDYWLGDLRPDLYRESINDSDKVIMIPWRSKKKLEWMQDQLENGFTSFWP